MRRLMSIAALGGAALGCALLVAEAHETRSIGEGDCQMPPGSRSVPWTPCERPRAAAPSFSNACCC